ncbi:unnamed protein product [Ceutorhynchus assimilis]|uniref:HTH psq-type domain-containing protein n=1 Tax=Ceutorhynchus assimilis TaxID=467358 RepID=A0A9N9MJV5_9CUCU|nr:unnamed protein product [Ceutorhynchus assimilis]
MKEAILNIFNKNMSLRAAAQDFNLKRSTLQSRIKNILKSMTAEEFVQKYDDDGYDSETEKKGKVKAEKKNGKLKRNNDHLSSDTTAEIKKAKIQRIKKKVFEESSSSESENDIHLDDSGDNESFESLQDDDEVNINSYILVKFLVKTASIYYVGIVVDNISDKKFKVKYLRRRGNSNKFYFPQIEDIETCEQSDIYAKLRIYSKARRDSTLTFYHNFEGINVK